MTKDEILAVLVKNRTIIKKGTDYTFPSANKVTVRCKNLPAKYLGISGSQAMNLFFIDTKIPDFTEGPTRYALKTISDKSIKTFLQILADPSIDFTTLVVRTSSYFNAKNTAKPSMSKYFTDGLWKIVYATYEEGSTNRDNIVWR